MTPVIWHIPNLYFLDNKGQIIESDRRLHQYEYNNEGRLIKSESIDKKNSKKVTYVYEYKDDLLVKSFRYENDQLVQMNEIEYEHYIIEFPTYFS